MLPLSARERARRGAKSGIFYGLFADCRGRRRAQDAITIPPGTGFSA
jgi:hypothetical protein